ncbi:MAG: pyruvate kinase alpha/beta domain-containing protein [Pseudomonadota bacterium]
MPDDPAQKTLYFARPGPKNTKALLERAAERFFELGLKKVVLATCTGRTVAAALELFPPARGEVIAVTHVAGFSEPNAQELDPGVRADLEKKGVRVVTAAHAFGGVGRGVRRKLGSFQVDEVMAEVLRMFGQGVKVAVEISLMAADSGLVRVDEDILAIGGTGRGADTALVLQPANSHSCLNLKIREVVAKPRDF